MYSSWGGGRAWLWSWIILGGSDWNDVDGAWLSKPRITEETDLSSRQTLVFSSTDLDFWVLFWFPKSSALILCLILEIREILCYLWFEVLSPCYSLRRRKRIQNIEIRLNLWLFSGTRSSGSARWLLFDFLQRLQFFTCFSLHNWFTNFCNFIARAIGTLLGGETSMRINWDGETFIILV